MFVRRKKLLHPNKYFRLTEYIPHNISYNVLVKPPVRVLRKEMTRQTRPRTGRKMVAAKANKTLRQ